MTADEKFFEQYKPVKNHFVDDCAFNGCMFETYGEEEQFVIAQAKADSRKVWTVIDVNGVMYITNGFRYIDRMGYFICEVPFDGEFAEFRCDGCMGEETYFLYKENFTDSQWYDFIKEFHDLPEFEKLFDKFGEVKNKYADYFNEGADVEVKHLKMRIEDNSEFLAEFLDDSVHATDKYRDAILDFIGDNLFVFQGIEGGFKVNLNGDGETKEFIFDDYED